MSMPQAGGMGVPPGSNNNNNNNPPPNSSGYQQHHQSYPQQRSAYQQPPQQQPYAPQNSNPQYQQPYNSQPQQPYPPRPTNINSNDNNTSPLNDFQKYLELINTKLAPLKKYKKVINPYLPFTCRLLLVSTFVEDGIRILFEMKHQIDFLKHEYYIPRFFASIMLLSNIFISFVAVALLLGRKKIARGHYEIQASYALIACVVYQQILYGRHSPIASGNLGFFVRNLCLSGSLLLISVQSRLASGKSALPMGLLDSKTDQQSTISYVQLASRIMLVLLGLEFMSTLGLVGTILAIPVIIAVLVGYQSEISGAILLILYFLHNVLNSAFWSVSGSYVTQIMQYEFFQTLSIMGGLLTLIMTGPGAISVDEMRSRKAF